MSETEISVKPEAVVFDVGRVLVQWDLRRLFAPLIDDPAELDWFLANVVTEQWHHQHDEGRALADMVPERQAEFPGHAELIDAYRYRFLESIPGPVEGTHELARRLAGSGMPLYGLTNFGTEFWGQFRPTEPLFDLFADVVVSGDEKCAKPEPRIYEVAEQRFAHAPGALFFIDDKAENVAAAMTRGWQGHVFTDAGSLERELVSLGLLD